MIPLIFPINGKELRIFSNRVIRAYSLLVFTSPFGSSEIIHFQIGIFLHAGY